MERISVVSSNISEIGYDANTMTLEVLFQNNTTYQYFDVPEAVYEELLRATSVGQFFNANVRNAYRNSKL